MRRTASGASDRRFRCATAVLVACLTATAAPPAARAGAAAGHALALAPRAAAPTLVLTLEGPEDLAGPLTGAMHKALTERGLGKPDQDDLPLVELRMTMGCEGNVPTCLAEGGKTLGAGSLAYGSVVVQGDRAKVSVVLLDVASAQVVSEVEETVPVSEIRSDAGAVGERLVARLLGEAPPAPVAEPVEATGAQDGAAGRDRGRLVWGRYEPVPTWKWAFLGTSAALFVGSLATAAAATAIRAPNGPLRDDILEAAKQSLEDDKASNDIDPNMGGDLCEAARATPPGEPDPNKVTNAKITELCNRGDALAKVATATWITTGIFAATTIAATTLLFVRKVPGSGERALRFGGAVGRDGGFVTASFRF